MEDEQAKSPLGRKMRDANWDSVKDILLSPSPIRKKAMPIAEESEAATDTAGHAEIHRDPTLILKTDVPPPNVIEREIYFGEKARVAFFDAYRHLSRQQHVLSGMIPGKHGIEVLKNLRSTSFEELELKLALHSGDVSIDEDDDRLAPAGWMNMKAHRGKSPMINTRLLAHREALTAEETAVFASNDESKKAYSTASKTRSKEKERDPNRDLAAIRLEALKNKTTVESRGKNTIRERLGLQKLRRCDSYIVERSAQELHFSRPAETPDAFMRPGSPRTRYLTGCLQHNVAPRPNLIVRSQLTSALNIEYQYIGDTMATILANSLEGLPFLSELNVAGNKLTDIGLTAIIKALPKCPYVTTVRIESIIMKTMVNVAFCLFPGEYIGEQDRRRSS